jgi:hypothetical protein
MKNLIIGMASTFNFKDIEIFFKTLERTGYVGKLVLLSLNPANIVIPPTTKIDVEIVSYAGSPHLPMGLGCYRPRVYLDYLRSTAGQYDKVFLTDTRDVFFQSSPFDYPFTAAMNFFLEDSSMAIKNCQFNRAWVYSIYGAPGLAKIGDRHICNVSLSLGTYAGMINYLELTLPQLTSSMTGADMAVHSYMVHTGAFPDYQIFDNGEGGIATIGYTKTPVVNKARQIIDPCGKAVAAVHQYDRHPDIVQYLHELIA